MKVKAVVYKEVTNGKDIEIKIRQVKAIGTFTKELKAQKWSGGEEKGFLDIFPVQISEFTEENVKEAMALHLNNFFRFEERRFTKEEINMYYIKEKDEYVLDTKQYMNETEE